MPVQGSIQSKHVQDRTQVQKSAYVQCRVACMKCSPTLALPIQTATPNTTCVNEPAAPFANDGTSCSGMASCNYQCATGYVSAEGSEPEGVPCTTDGAGWETISPANLTCKGCGAAGLGRIVAPVLPVFLRGSLALDRAKPHCVLSVVSP